MKPLILLLTVVVLSACATTAPKRAASPEDTAWKTAMRSDIPGKFQHGHCAEYAGNLLHLIRPHADKAHVLYYAWERNVRNMFQENIGGHAITVWKSGKRAYGMDNTRTDPKMLPWGNATTMAEWFVGPHFSVEYAHFPDCEMPPIPGWTPGKHYAALIQNLNR